MYFVTSNEQNGMTSAPRQADAESIFRNFKDWPIVFWQEISRADSHADIVAQEPSGYYHAFPDLPNPISVPGRFDVIEECWAQAKPRTPELGPTGDAARYYGILRLKDTKVANRPEFYVLNTHFTNGGEWDNPDPSERALTLRPYWTAHWDMVKAEIDAIKAKDCTVFFGGDFNCKDAPRFGSAQKLAVGNGTIDKLAVIDRSIDTTLINTGTIATRSDHEAKWANWSLFNRT